MSHAPELQPCAGEYAMTVVFIRNRQEDLECGVRERYEGMGLSDDELLALQLRDELREAYENSNIAGRFVVKALVGKPSIPNDPEEA